MQVFLFSPVNPHTGNSELLRNIKRSNENVTKEFIINLLSIVAFDGRHLKIVIYSPQAFIENFLISFFIVVSL
jgi:hypothetical protein